ncbi:hypothetical protein [Ancylobacter oerskovii]|uniref:Uncharacterized protein n=1 Tax=Ancylobacter oerskovii TaxID=459519 RepID=A0ABW4YY81_9HYPH|nr:hypothetical protein [Ancylobacter oerskovii]MBS7541944.1 hypothetical protein [Ancylobacter oerskovii]
MSRIVRHRHTLMFALAYGAIAAAVLFVHPGASEAEAPAAAVTASATSR